MGTQPVNGETVTVLIENTYTCGRESADAVTVPAPAVGQDVDAWWDEHLHGRTGDGHPCGSREHALYEVRIAAAVGQPDLVGEWTSWEG
jgi:hypothetical protein